MNPRIPDLSEPVVLIRLVATTVVLLVVAIFAGLKSLPLFSLLFDHSMAYGAANALGMTCAYVLLVLDRWTDDRRRRLNGLDHVLAGIAIAGISGFVGFVAALLSNS